MKTAWAVEVWYKPEVTDPVENSLKKGVTDLDIAGLHTVKTGHKYIFEGSMTRDQMDRVCRELLANPVIQTYRIQPFKGPTTMGVGVSPLKQEAVHALLKKGSRRGRPKGRGK